VVRFRDLAVIGRRGIASGMSRTRLIVTGVIGAAVAALCCFTPVLVILLGALGLSAATGYLDYVLLPAALIFVCITVYGFTRRSAA
jgi:mercuric ion transport protein